MCPAAPQRTPAAPIRFRVNGEAVAVSADPFASLAGTLRDRLGLTDKTQLHGWLDPRGLGRLLTESSAAILPSHEENFSLAVLSAMAVGTPLIATRVGGTSELVEHGHNGVLCPPGDVGALGAAIAQLCDEPGRAAALAARGRRRVRDDFTWGAAARKFESVYERAGKGRL